MNQQPKITALHCRLSKDDERLGEESFHRDTENHALSVRKGEPSVSYGVLH